LLPPNTEALALPDGLANWRYHQDRKLASNCSTRTAIAGSGAHCFSAWLTPASGPKTGSSQLSYKTPTSRRILPPKSCFSEHSLAELDAAQASGPGHTLQPQPGAGNPENSTPAATTLINSLDTTFNSTGELK